MVFWFFTATSTYMCFLSFQHQVVFASTSQPFLYLIERTSLQGMPLVSLVFKFKVNAPHTFDIVCNTSWWIAHFCGHQVPHEYLQSIPLFQQVPSALPAPLRACVCEHLPMLPTSPGLPVVICIPLSLGVLAGILHILVWECGPYLPT